MSRLIYPIAVLGVGVALVHAAPQKVEAKPAESKGGCTCAARHTVPGRTALTIMRAAGRPLARGRRAIRRGWVREPRSIPENAHRIFRSAHRRWRWAERIRFDLPRRLEHARRTLGRAGDKLRRWSRGKRPRRRRQEAGRGCALGASVAFLIKTARGNGPVASVFDEGGAIDGCLYGAAGALVPRSRP